MSDYEKNLWDSLGGLPKSEEPVIENLFNEWAKMDPNTRPPFWEWSYKIEEKRRSRVCERSEHDQ